jgi:hypothetical protein
VARLLAQRVDHAVRPRRAVRPLLVEFGGLALLAFGGHCLPRQIRRVCVLLTILVWPGLLSAIGLLLELHVPDLLASRALLAARLLLRLRVLAGQRALAFAREAEVGWLGAAFAFFERVLGLFVGGITDLLFTSLICIVHFIVLNFIINCARLTLITVRAVKGVSFPIPSCDSLCAGNSRCSARC